MDEIIINIHGNQNCSQTPMGKLTIDCNSMSWTLLGFVSGVGVRSGNLKVSGIGGLDVDLYLNGKVYLKIQGLSLTKPGAIGRVVTIIEHPINAGQTKHTCYGRIK